MLKSIVVFTYLLMIGVNALANILPINGVNTGQVSDSYANLFAPAGITFSIWGIIYLLLAVFSVYQLELRQKKSSKQKHAAMIKIRKLFAFSSIVNATWIFAWHYQLLSLSVLLMGLLLLSLILIADVLNTQTFSKLETISVALPFRVYFGWITVATIANITTLLVSLGWDGFGLSNEVWTIVVVIVGAIIGIWRAMKDRSVAYTLVLIWAYFGIWFKHTSATGFNGEYRGVIVVVLTSIVLFVCTIGFLLLKQSRPLTYRTS